MAIMMPVDIESLSIEARLDLITQIWKSIDANRSAVPYTSYQQQVVRERLEAHESGPDAEMSLDEFRASINTP
jgi:putative addiction module component (TIGR02574 family)